jgi:hypothetical protein
MCYMSLLICLSDLILRMHKILYVYLLRSKNEALESFIHYKKEVENQLNKKIKVLRSDRGEEYESPMGEFCS